MRIFLSAGLMVVALASRAAAQPSPSGADLFGDRCAMCHLAGGGGQGPSLTGVAGRKAGGTPGFAYTPAMKASNLTWTPDNLDRFLADPAKLVPGTAMPIRVPDAAQRGAIIGYLTSKK
jgi:cytochrome c